MASQWTFGQKIAAGFALVTGLTVVVTVMGVYELNQIIEEKDHTINVSAKNLHEAQALTAAFAEKVAADRGFLIDHDPKNLEEAEGARRTFLDLLQALEKDLGTDQGRRYLEEIKKLEEEHEKRTEHIRDTVRKEKQAELSAVAREFDERLKPIEDQIQRIEHSLDEYERKLLDEEVVRVNADAEQAVYLLSISGALAVLFAIAAAFTLTRQLTVQLGSAIQHMQSASAELNGAATEQASSTTEQTAATTEASTTLKELVATAKQMMEGAQRVTRIAEQSATTARGGDATVVKAQDAINSIKKQVDLIVQHMLDLGKKSQQVGVVLELINELAEQTNILAINATIESAGAGEAGKRFAVVADEIRKLADRVGASTKEIRTLIEEIRSSANTTVMATEDGSKAVDAGTKQFAEVATTFRQIADGVVTTTEASREIELGTRQQVTAVEQVSSALSGIQTAAKQSEVAARQTQETSGNLVALAKNLQAMVQAA